MYKTHMGCLYGVRERVKRARDLVSVRKVGRCGLHERSMLLLSYVKPIIVKSMVDIILCLCVQCNYTYLLTYLLYGAKSFLRS